MAINPNTDFSAGAVLTAAQQNRFPRGIVALSTVTTSVAAYTTEMTRTSLTFTAVANRYYKISYIEQSVQNSVGAGTESFYIRPTTVATAALATGSLTQAASYQGQSHVVAITTFSAGSQTIYARAVTNSGSGMTLVASATVPAYLIVEDLGPA
jgi:hypothetical protein